MTRQIIVLLCFLNQVLCAQRTEVLHESGYHHDYALSSMTMIENLADTPRCKYIATVRLSGEHGDALIGNSVNLLSIKAKELGANMYIVKSYKQDEKNAEVIVRMFFAPEKFKTENDGKRIKNTVYVFNQYRGKADTAWLYVNKEKIVFDQGKFYKIDAKSDQQYNLELTPSKRGGIKILYAKPKVARFMVVPADKRKLAYIGAPGTVGVVSSGAGQGVNLYVLGFKKNQIHELDYDLGRFLIEIYK